MNLSYNAWKNYVECPKKFFLKHLKKLPSTIPRNDYFALYGKLTEKFFQLFCNTWRFKTPYMFPEDIYNKLKILYDRIIDSSEVDWSAPFVELTKDDIFKQSYADICAIMDSQNQNYFLNTKSELSIEVETKDNIKINGRLDFVHKDAVGNGVTIIDGKGTTNIGKNIDDNQILFYSLLYFFHFKVMPEQIGFFYYRFNLFKPLPINMDIINEFRARLSLDLKKIKSESVYLATPCPKSCKYCDYRNVCPECAADQAKRKRGSKLDIPGGDSGEIINIGF